MNNIFFQNMYGNLHLLSYLRGCFIPVRKYHRGYGGI